MATKKQIIYPIVFILAGIGGFIALSSMKKPPEEKKVEISVPVVSVKPIEVAPLQLKVGSQGVVEARYETRMVAQVNGQITLLAEEFVRGGFVKKGQLLARIDPSDYEAALIEAQANHASALASLEQEQAQGHVAKEEWKNVSDAAPSDLGLRRPQLKQEQAKVKAAEASVKRAKRNLERTEVVAPYDALIGSRSIGLGSYVGTGTELGKLLSTALAEVRLPVSTDELQYLSEGGVNAEVELSSSVGGKLLIWKAKIARSEGVIDAKSRMSYLVAEVQQPYGDDKETLRFGTYVSAKINGILLPLATLVPRHLIVEGKVAVLGGDNKLNFKSVVVIRQQARDAVITQGLVNGESLIISAMDYPIEGMSLALKSDKALGNGDDTVDAAKSQLAMKEE
ncbi:MAG: efflux RND transporter periplasmic adaptor subunit [Algicola sp.]|nr:efflux RND transporter periplasmic adaptor subunit [Algicola sp.]